MNLDDAVIQLHDIARGIVDDAPTYSFEIRRVADALHGHMREQKERDERTRYTHSAAKKKTVIVTDCIGGEDND